MPCRSPRQALRAVPEREKLAPRAAGSRGFLSFSGENGEVLGVVGKAPDYLRALLRGERPVEIHDELSQILVPAPVLANELLGAVQLRSLERLGEMPAELLRFALSLERRDEIALPAPPVLEAQRDVALVSVASTGAVSSAALATNLR